MKYFLTSVLCFLVLLLSPLHPYAQTLHKVYFENTDHELFIYKIQGKKDGNTMMIIGGIQGNEPGGYLSADLYADISLAEGNIIVVPRANFKSIIQNKRQINKDMNRRFINMPNPYIYEDKIVSILKDLLRESDILLNLHDGHGYYSEKWESELRNPKRFGMSIIADSEEYYSKKYDKVLKLGDTAREVVEKVNAMVESNDHRFLFNNTRTADSDSPHPEQKRSATFYALTELGIPAFGVETSKDIFPHWHRTKLQVLVVNTFLDLMGIKPEFPPIKFERPILEFLVISVNGARPVVVKNSEELTLTKGDTIKIEQVETNYRRGISIDIAGIGGYNDFHKDFRITKPTKILVKKDSFQCGEVMLTMLDKEKIVEEEETDITPPSVNYLHLTANGVERYIPDKGELTLMMGDILKIVDVSLNGLSAADVKVNFVGFVGNKVENDGEDRGYQMDTSADLIKKFSLNKKGDEYRITVNYKGKEIGGATLKFNQPRLEYLLARINNSQKMWFKSSDVIKLYQLDTLEIVDVMTNVSNNNGLVVNFRGYVGGTDGEDRNYTITPADLLKNYSVDHKGREYKIIVTRGSILLGEVPVRISKGIKTGKAITIDD